MKLHFSSQPKRFAREQIID